MGALEGESDLIQLDRLETPTARRWRGSQTVQLRGDKMEGGGGERRRGLIRESGDGE